MYAQKIEKPCINQNGSDFCEFLDVNQMKIGIHCMKQVVYQINEGFLKFYIFGIKTFLQSLMDIQDYCGGCTVIN